MGRELAAVAVALAGCAGGSSGPVDTDPTRDVPGVETTLAIEPGRIAPGGVAVLTLTVANVGDDEVRFRFARDRQLGLMIRADGEVERVDARTVPLPRYLSLGPFEEWTHTIEWDGAFDDAGRRTPLSAGSYELQAGFRRAGEEYVNLSNVVPVEILP